MIFNVVSVREKWLVLDNCPLDVLRCVTIRCIFFLSIRRALVSLPITLIHLCVIQLGAEVGLLSEATCGGIGCQYTTQSQCNEYPMHSRCLLAPPIAPTPR